MYVALGFAMVVFPERSVRRRAGPSQEIRGVSAFEFVSCWIHLFLELPCLDVRSTLVRITLHERSKDDIVWFPSELLLWVIFWLDLCFLWRGSFVEFAIFPFLLFSYPSDLPSSLWVHSLQYICWFFFQFVWGCCCLVCEDRIVYSFLSNRVAR